MCNVISFTKCCKQPYQLLCLVERFLHHLHLLLRDKSDFLLIRFFGRSEKSEVVFRSAKVKL